MLVLYALPQSPYCAKVRATLRWKGVSFEEKEPPGGSYKTTEYQSLVPSGSIPAIKQGDWLLHDSQAIMEYLEEVYPTPSIWSTDRQRRAHQRSLVHFHDARLEPKVRELVPLVRQPDSREREIAIGVIRDNLFDRLYRLERMLGGEGSRDVTGLCAVDWTFAPTIHMASDVLDYLGSSLNIPDSVFDWVEWASDQPLVRQEVECLRGAIAQWLRNESGLVNQG